MEERILFEIPENNSVYYMVKMKESSIPIRILREELIKRNSKLVELYEKQKEKSLNPFLKRKREAPDSNRNNSEDISSDETQHIYRNTKIKKEKNFSHASNNKFSGIQQRIIPNNNKNEFSSMNIHKEKSLPNINTIKSFKEDKKFYEREGSLLQDIPIKVINVGYKNRSEKKLYCLVKWKQKEKIRILDSIVECEKMKKDYPLLLLDFYESKLVFLDGD